MISQEGVMTSRRCPSSPVAPPLEDYDLLCKILLRLPPQPSSLPRACLVFKRWHGLVSDPRFLPRFHLHHRRNPPLLGLFYKDYHHKMFFISTMEAPNYIPRNLFSRLADGGKTRFLLLGCRHGVVLIFHMLMDRLLVWDPVTAAQHNLSIPPGFEGLDTPINGAVLRSTGDAPHFQVVMVGTEKQHPRATARVYSSETGIWGNLISPPLPSKGSNTMSQFPNMIYTEFPVVLVGDYLYWFLSDSLLEFDLDMPRLVVIPIPVDMDALVNSRFSVMRAYGGGLGCLFLSEFSAQLWKRKTDCDGVTSWVLGRTIELDKLLSMDSAIGRASLVILGFAEDSNVAILGFLEKNNAMVMWTVGLFTVQLQSLKFKKHF